ncbi:hypothetical protein [Streptomyces sp. NPDC101455]|uniref:hypothetical protein n=1 Tax=Streptomyces sp. NPDC101455 TaxID=3366142 RepID=UPI00382B6303
MLLRDAQQAVRGQLPCGYDTIVELRADRVELILSALREPTGSVPPTGWTNGSAPKGFA